MYAPPYALRSTTHSRGTVAAAYACTQLGAVADHPAPLEVLARLEAGRVDERESGMLKQSHHCTKRAAFCDASMSRRAGALLRLVGDDADGAPVEPAERR